MTQSQFVQIWIKHSKINLKAFKDIAKTKEGHKIISEVYSHEGYTDAKDSDFDIVRKYEKQVQDMK